MAGRAVQRTPYAGALALLDYTISIWPYMNGKGIAHGLQLSGLEASDMLDVAHYFMEDDFSATSSEQSEARSRMRTILYESFYKIDYKYKVSSSGRSHNFDLGPPLDDLTAQDNDDIRPFDPSNGGGGSSSPQPYTPPTPVDANSPLPFGKLLDPPMN